MRRILLALLAAATLGGCVSLLENVYDEQARAECDRVGDRGECYDRVEQNRRERRN